MAAIDTAERGDAWEQRRAQMSLRIELAGLELMSERSLDDVTVEHIAREAGISVRTFFRYFRNPRDILTAVPRRESLRMREALLARPAGESLLDGFHAWFHELDGDQPRSPTAALERDAFVLWSGIVREEPELIQSESRAISVLSADLAEVVRRRLTFGRDDEEKVGMLSTAFAAVIWYVYSCSVADENGADLGARLDQAFDLLGHLHTTSMV
jgi:AcrR family transcriptional regulator